MDVLFAIQASLPELIPVDVSLMRYIGVLQILIDILFGWLSVICPLFLQNSLCLMVLWFLYLLKDTFGSGLYKGVLKAKRYSNGK